MRTLSLPLLLGLGACEGAAPCPTPPSSTPLLLGPELREQPLRGPAGWTVTASVSGPFVWRPEAQTIGWSGMGYDEGRIVLTHRDPAGACPSLQEEREVRASAFVGPRLAWRTEADPSEVPAGLAVGVEVVVRNEGHSGTWLPAPTWRGGGAEVTADGPVWVPALADASQSLTLVAEGGRFAGTLDWGELALQWRGEGLVPRLHASESLDFGTVLLGDVKQRSIGLRALNVPVELVHIEGPEGSPFEWTEVDEVEDVSALPVRFAPTEVGTWSETLRIWWRGRERIEVHEVQLEGTALGCDEACALPRAVATCGDGCRIERCHSDHFDANGLAGDGCECADPADPSGDCARATALAELRDDGSGATFDGVLAGPEDADVLRLIAADGSHLFSESFDLRIRLEAPDGVQLCVRRALGRWPKGSCAPSTLECGPRHRIEGRFLKDDTQTLWLHLRNPSRTCASYRVSVSNG